MNRLTAKHLADYEKNGWEEVKAIADYHLKRIAEAENKYKINKQKEKIRKRTQ